MSPFELVFIAAIAFVLLALVSFQFGLELAAFLVSLYALALLPRNLIYVGGDESQFHVGISPAVPVVSSYSLVLSGFALVLLLFRTSVSSIRLWLPLFVWLCIGVGYEWGPRPAIISGAIQLLLGLVGWVVGSHARRASMRDGRRWGSWGTAGLCLVVIVQFVAVLMQAAGIIANPIQGASAQLLEGRYEGTLYHPNDLGKVLVLVLILLACIWLTSRRSFPWLLVWCTFALGGVTLLLTGGRAVAVGMVLSLVVWALLLPSAKENIAKKVSIMLYAGVGAVVAWFVLADRFAEDPEGGARSVLTDTALKQIASSPLFGTGPNNYVAVVGQWDPLTASGVPVHNTILLAIAELGWLGAVALGLPFLWATLRGVRSLRHVGAIGVHARLLVCLVPLVVIVAATGWGLLGSYIFPLLGLVYGFLMEGLAPRSEESPMSANEVIAGSPSRSRPGQGELLS